MLNNTIELKSIEELLSYKFFIPNYQRGYRWTKQQVKDLLNDIYEFQLKYELKLIGASEIYCIQPLVIKKNYNYWDVIDGQQRLTTILILLSYLNNSKKYSIEYETRKRSNEFLNNITLPTIEIDGTSHTMEEISNSNIDFHHMYEAYQTIKNWFKGYKNDKGNFEKILLNNVKFIWYETKESDPIKVFTRLNIGKIALTDAELIKALFLNSTNFGTTNKEQIRLQQIEIASEWDRIEYALQDDEFWLFLHDLKYNKATRIDFIFDIIKRKDIFKLEEQLEKGCYEEAIGADEHQTFRYFYEYFKQNRTGIDSVWLRKLWSVVKRYYQIFEEWYNDIELYHYVGYLIATGSKLDDIIEEYNSNKHNKQTFKEYLKEEIKKSIIKCNNLDKIYGENGECNKRNCFPLLLLFNIQTVIDQNSSLKNAEKYSMGVTYKFPFHLFKKEGKKQNGKGWEVEHIASNSGDNLDDVKNQEIWLAAMRYGIYNDKIKEEIDDFLVNPDSTKFDKIKQDLADLDLNPINGKDKQKIWNFALLDSSTNEEYQNDPFPIKRICIMAKENGKKAIVSYNENKKYIEITEEESSAFVPPCTKNVFTKAYTNIPKSLGSWSKDDARSYKEAIFNKLEKFGVTKQQ